MKAPARDDRQVLRLCRGIQSGQLRAQLLVMLGLDASFGARAVKALKPSMTECLDHILLYPDRIQDARSLRSAIVALAAGLAGAS
jgi:hypothetical protein